MAKVLITSHRLGHFFHLMVNGVAAAAIKVGFACEVPDEHLDALRATDPEMKMTVLADDDELQKAIDAITFLDSLPRETRDKAMDAYFNRKTALEDGADRGPTGKVIGLAAEVGAGDQSAAGGQSSAASQGEGSSSNQGADLGAAGDGANTDPAANGEGEGTGSKEPAPADDPNAPKPGNTDTQELPQGASA